MRPYAPEIDKAAPAPVSIGTAVIGPIAANIAFVMELTLVPLLLPAIQAQLNMSIGGLAWVFNSYGIAVAVGVLLGGCFGDLFNTRRVFGLGVALFAIGALLVAAAENFDTLIMGRAIQGLGGGMFSPLVPLLLTRASPDRPGRALIVWGSIAGYVAAFAPLFYGSFLGDQGWTLAFTCIALVAGISLAMLVRPHPGEDPAPGPRAPKDFAMLFRSGKLWVTYIYVFCTYGAITYYLFRLPVLLAQSEDRAASVGFVLSLVWLTFSALSTILRNMVDRPHLRMIMVAAPLLIAAGLPLAHDSETLLLLLSPMVIGAGLACSNAPSTQLILRFAPRGMSGVSTSLDITFARLGGIATVALLAEARIALAAPVIGVACLVAAVCALTACRGFTEDA